MSPILGIYASQVSGKLWPASSYESIATVTGTGSSYLSFTSIPQTYTHLQLRGFVRDNVAALTQDPLYLKMNNDTGNNYDYHSFFGDGATASGTSTLAAGLMVIGTTTGGSSSANIFGVCVVDILDYTNTNKYKTVRSLSGNDQNGSGRVGSYSGLWKSTAAVNRLDFGVSNYYDSVNTVWALYGIKGAV